MFLVSFAPLKVRLGDLVTFLSVFIGQLYDKFYILKIAKDIPVYQQSISLYLRPCNNCFSEKKKKLNMGEVLLKASDLLQFSNFTPSFLWRKYNVCFSNLLLISKFQFIPKVPYLPDRTAQKSSQTSLLGSCPPRAQPAELLCLFGTPPSTLDVPADS